MTKEPSASNSLIAGIIVSFAILLAVFGPGLFRGSEGDREAATYDTMSKAGPFPASGSLCAQAERTRLAYAREGNAEQVRIWTMVTWGDCQ